ncbi:MAG: hypothetical protein AAGF79_10595 [Pseudomonadota bacterium]
MATTFRLSDDWTATNRYEAVHHGDVMLSNTGADDVRWTRTQDDEVPSNPPRISPILRPGDNLSVSVRPGHRIWMTGPVGSSVVIQPYI